MNHTKPSICLEKMKATYLLVMMFSLVLLTTSCEKSNEDDTASNKKNEYTIDGVAKEIKWIGISPELMYGEDGEYVINILPNIPIGDVGLFGFPEYIYLEIPIRLNGQTIDLKNVTSNFEWDFEYENPNYDIEGYCSDNAIEGDISSGSMSIKRLDSGYLFEINFDISSINGKKIQGYYKGVLKVGDIDTPFSTWE